MFQFLKRRPDFLIIGAQKAGTSALESFLSQHPRIHCANRKEIGFFNRDQLYQLGLGWYKSDMTPGTRKLLEDFFEPENAKLYSMIGRDFGW